MEFLHQDEHFLHKKIHFLIFLEKFGCLRNDENISLLDVPYRDPKYEFVFLSKSRGL